jgi:hypothetical protein
MKQQIGQIKWLALLLLPLLGCNPTKQSYPVSNLDCSGRRHVGDIIIGDFKQGYAALGRTQGFVDPIPNQPVILNVKDFWTNQIHILKGQLPPFLDDPKKYHLVVKLGRDYKEYKVAWYPFHANLEQELRDTIESTFHVVPVVIKMDCLRRDFLVNLRQREFDFPVWIESRDHWSDDYYTGYLCVESTASDVMFGLMSSRISSFEGYMCKIPISSLISPNAPDVAGVYLLVNEDHSSVKIHRFVKCSSSPKQLAADIENRDIDIPKPILDLQIQQAEEYRGPNDFPAPDLRFEDEKQNVQNKQNSAK